MISRIRFPIRVKILAAVLALLTITVAVITASMARVFGEDKTAYVNDVSAIIAGSAAAESATLLRGYLRDMDEISAALADPAVTASRREEVSSRLFARLPEVLSVSVVADGRPPVTLYDHDGLQALAISSDDLLARAMAGATRAPPGDADGVRATSLPLPGARLLVLARPLPVQSGERPRLLLTCIRADALARAVERGRGFHTALVDTAGNVLIESGASVDAGVQRRGWIQVMFGLPSPAQAGIVTREITADGTEYIAARAAVHVAGVSAIAAIPRAAAYLTARGLLDSLMVVSLALIVAGALVALVVSRRLTKPIEALADAAERVGQGQFDIRIDAQSSDEIGALASTFNSMAAGLQQRERALGEAQQALIRSEKMSAFGQLSAGIAHEVKNPLAGILGHAQLLMRRLGPDSPGRASVDLIARETKRCSDTISNLMRFARQDKPTFVALDINAVVEAALAIVDHQLSLQGIRLTRDLGEHLPPVEGDFNQLQQVLVNLAINAQQAMAAGRGEFRVRTRAEQGQVIIEAADTGPGMTPDVQARIFEPFFTTKSTGQGTGLGLSVSYGIIESHNGSIGVRSTPGTGATFIIRLPAAAAGQQEAAA